MLVTPADLNAKRLALRLSYGRLAERCRLAPTMVRNFLRGRPTGDPDFYGRLIAEALAAHAPEPPDHDATAARLRAFWSDRAFAAAMKGRRFS